MNFYKLCDARPHLGVSAKFYIHAAWNIVSLKCFSKAIVDRIILKISGGGFGGEAYIRDHTVCSLQILR